MKNTLLNGQRESASQAGKKDGQKTFWRLYDEGDETIVGIHDMVVERTGIRPKRYGASEGVPGPGHTGLPTLVWVCIYEASKDKWDDGWLGLGATLGALTSIDLDPTGDEIRALSRKLGMATSSQPRWTQR